MTILNQIVSNDMAKKGFKVLSYSYKEMPIESLNELMQEHDIESAAFREQLEADCIYVGTFALEDGVYKYKYLK